MSSITSNSISRWELIVHHTITLVGMTSLLCTVDLTRRHLKPRRIDDLCPNSRPPWLSQQGGSESQGPTLTHDVINRVWMSDHPTFTLHHLMLSGVELLLSLAKVTVVVATRPSCTIIGELCLHGSIQQQLLIRLAFTPLSQLRAFYACRCHRQPT